MFHRYTLLALALAAGATQAQTRLTPAPQRITDGAISADQRGYEALQARIKALNDGGRPLRDRHLAQAQCWLDTSVHEYTRNDRGPWPQAALSQAEQLVRAMELGQSLPAETPLVAGAERIRPDLWQRAAALRGHAGWPCAQAKAACGEVELVHAGHEQAQLGWRHARPYVQIAEDLIGDAEAQAQACRPPAPAAAVAAPVAVPAAPAAVPPAAPPRAELTLFAQVVFNFDHTTIKDVPAGGLVSLQALLQRVRDDQLTLQSVQLGGHADRLNGSGRADYNQALSERRVAAVRDFLLQQGVPADLIHVQALGDRVPRERCDTMPPGRKLQDCLLPNRRVEVSVTATRRP